MEGSEILGKHLIKSSDSFFYIVEEEWQELNQDLSVESFQNYGMESLTNIPPDKWLELEKPIKVLTWTENEDVDTHKVKYKYEEQRDKTLNIKTDEFVPMDKLNEEDSFSIMQYREIDEEEPSENTNKVKLFVPQYRLIDDLERPISILTYTESEEVPILRQEYSYQQMGTRILLRKNT